MKETFFSLPKLTNTEKFYFLDIITSLKKFKKKTYRNQYNFIKLQAIFLRNKLY